VAIALAYPATALVRSLIAQAVAAEVSAQPANGPVPEPQDYRTDDYRTPVPLTLRGSADRDGGALTISPVDPGHALQSATVTIKGASPIELGSDGRIQASDVQAALKDRPKEDKDRTYSVPVRISAHYVEMGTDRHGGGNYVLRYRWEGGGLFGGRSLRLVGLSR